MKASILIALWHMHEILPNCLKTPLTDHRNKFTVKCPQIVCYIFKINLRLVMIFTATIDLSSDFWNIQMLIGFIATSEQQHTVLATDYGETVFIL